MNYNPGAKNVEVLTKKNIEIKIEKNLISNQGVITKKINKKKLNGKNYTLVDQKLK